MDTIVSILLLVFLTYILYLAYLSSPLINRDGTWGHTKSKGSQGTPKFHGYFDYTKELSNINKDNSDLVL